MWEIAIAALVIVVVIIFMMRRRGSYDDTEEVNTGKSGLPILFDLAEGKSIGTFLNETKSGDPTTNVCHYVEFNSLKQKHLLIPANTLIVAKRGDVPGIKYDIAFLTESLSGEKPLIDFLKIGLDKKISILNKRLRSLEIERTSAEIKGRRAQRSAESGAKDVRQMDKIMRGHREPTSENYNRSAWGTEEDEYD